MKHALASVELVEGHNIHWNEEIQRERQTAITDLLETNHFIVKVAPEQGPYHLRLSQADGRLLLDIHTIAGGQVVDISLALSPFRSLMKEYFAVCEAYSAAQKQHHLAGLETIDMGRRGLHNDGADLLKTVLAERIELDHATARRLFTLLCVLNLRELGR